MNKKEIAEIKKAFKPDSMLLTANKSYVCYFDECQNVIWDKYGSFAMEEEEETAAYTDLLKKTLAGKLGKQLNTYQFSENSTAADTLPGLCNGAGEPEIKKFVRDAAVSLGFVFRWTAILSEYTYSVPRQKNGKSSGDGGDDAADFDDFTFYIFAAVPMERKAAGLCYDDTANELRTKSDGLWTAAKTPVAGFMYPLFTGRTSDATGFLAYSKNKDLPVVPLITDVLGGEYTMAPAEENAKFHAVLRNVCGGAVDFDLAKAVCEEAAEKISSDGFADADGQPLLGVAELKGILTRNGHGDLAGSAEEEWAKEFGAANVQILAVNVTDTTKTVIQAPDVSVSVAADKTGSVREKVVDGVKCIVIPVTDGGVTVNEMDVR